MCLLHLNPKQVFQADTPKHLCSHTISHTVDDLGSVLGGVDMATEGACAQRHIDDVDNRPRDVLHIGVGRFQCRKAFEGLLRHTGVRSVFILGGPLGVRWF
ncbi:MAG: hypothetical protein ACFWT5_10780 [Pseudomonas helleri]